MSKTPNPTTDPVVYHETKAAGKAVHYKASRL